MPYRAAGANCPQVMRLGQEFRRREISLNSLPTLWYLGFLNRLAFVRWRQLGGSKLMETSLDARKVLRHL